MAKTISNRIISLKTSICCTPEQLYKPVVKKPNLLRVLVSYTTCVPLRTNLVKIGCELERTERATSASACCSPFLLPPLRPLGGEGGEEVQDACYRCFPPHYDPNHKFRNVRLVAVTLFHPFELFPRRAFQHLFITFTSNFPGRGEGVKERRKGLPVHLLLP